TCSTTAAGSPRGWTTTSPRPPPPAPPRPPCSTRRWPAGRRPGSADDLLGGDAGQAFQHRPARISQELADRRRWHRAGGVRRILLRERFAALALVTRRGRPAREAATRSRVACISS